jgi:hypothetical protein
VSQPPRGRNLYASTAVNLLGGLIHEYELAAA